jgi:hypothetical protein
MRVRNATYLQLVRLPTFQARHFQVFGYDSGINIGCRSNVLQTDLFTKICSTIWLPQNFLVRYNSFIS